MLKSVGDYEVAEDYELQPSNNVEDPLLPTHSRHELVPLPPRQQLQRQRQSMRQKSIFTCLCLNLLILFLALGLMTCYFGRVTLDKVKSWDQLPPNFKNWLNDLAPTKTHADHANFPTDVGYAGPTPTGKEPALMLTAPFLPTHTDVYPLIPPSAKSSQDFSIIQHWGHLSPYRTVESHGLSESKSLVPETCELDRLIWLQRHGARYPTSYPGGPGAFASRLKFATGWTASGDLSFLNEWNYQLGAEILVPFGRSQLYDLGVSARIKYGFLLDRFKSKLPVFRTESQDRMLKSAQNFAAGFFGIPAEDQYNLEVIIEAPGFNNSLAPYTTCLHTDNIYEAKLAEWDTMFLQKAKKRLQKDMDGYELSLIDIVQMMEMCAYETVALGYSAFCELFNQREWKGFQYRNDLYWWYSGSFGYAPAKAMGIGWVQELISRLTETRLVEFNSNINSSFHDDVHFPLGDPLYVDFTHDTLFAHLLPAMNLTTFAETGELPTDHIPDNRSFISSRIIPFATNLQVQVLSCSSDRNIRIVLNDAVVPLTGISGCPKSKDGLCPLDAFVSAMHSLIGEVDFAKECGLRRKDGEEE
ncbi:uncharacterized protein L203_105333 [Cryptococcus depauperatus CBS 7841]|uniref:Phytase n=1 Tax=Cryptococcus depauperatus CBS 7841 TaxID=1295531 RepID=A0AAJ8JX55_9TREE